MIEEVYRSDLTAPALAEVDTLEFLLPRLDASSGRCNCRRGSFVCLAVFWISDWIGSCVAILDLAGYLLDISLFGWVVVVVDVACQLWAWGISGWPPPRILGELQYPMRSSFATAFTGYLSGDSRSSSERSSHLLRLKQ